MSGILIINFKLYNFNDGRLLARMVRKKRTEKRRKDSKKKLKNWTNRGREENKNRKENTSQKPHGEVALFGKVVHETSKLRTKLGCLFQSISNR